MNLEQRTYKTGIIKSIPNTVEYAIPTILHILRAVFYIVYIREKMGMLILEHHFHKDTTVGLEYPNYLKAKVTRIH